MASNDVNRLKPRSDGQDVELKVPKILTDKPWYTKDEVEAPVKPRNTSEWQAKRDAWANYDSSEYKAIIDKFDESQPAKKAKMDTNEKIVDNYSRSVSQPSFRDVKDTAHYLLDVGSTDSFENAGVLKSGKPESVEGQSSEQLKSPQVLANRKPIPVDEPPPPSSSGLLEDYYPKNHTSVYGSWFSKGRWGYSCCHQLNASSSCTANPESEDKASKH